MPRSVNAVAARARRKKIMKMTKGQFGRRKNVWTVAKNSLEKGLHTLIEKPAGVFGSNECKGTGLECKELGDRTA